MSEKESVFNKGNVGNYGRDVSSVSLRRKNNVRMLLKLYFLIAVLAFLFMIFYFMSARNPDIYAINKETISVINQAFNALIILVIPFLLGVLGAISRVLIAGMGVIHTLSLILSSGLMATFSWVGVKSGVLLSVVAPHIEKQGIEASPLINSQNSFYTMALVAIFVGMFSTNLYLFISQKVEQLTFQAKRKKFNSSNHSEL